MKFYRFIFKLSSDYEQNLLGKINFIIQSYRGTSTAPNGSFLKLLLHYKFCNFVHSDV